MLDQVLKESKQFLKSSDFPILAIDYGERRFGIAVSDSKGLIGSPITTLVKSKKKKIETIINEILEISIEYDVKGYLLGVPYAFEEQHLEIQQRISDFAEKLSQISKKKIYYYSEVYSSKEATTLIKEYGPVNKDNGKVDKLSAMLFLQNFLDGNNKQQI